MVMTSNEKEKRFFNIWYKFYFSKLYMTENPLDNCNFVYLDMGTNFGVQIRWELVHSCSPTLFSESCTSLISIPALQYWKSLINTLGPFRAEIQTRLEVGSFQEMFKHFQSEGLCCWLGAQSQACWISPEDERGLQILWISGSDQYQGRGWSS